MMKVGIISDTHGVFGPQFIDFFADCDEIWHAGDFGGGYSTAAAIAGFKPLVGVVGNCDERGMMYDYPLHKFFSREGMNILMTHIGGYPGHYDYRALQLIERYRPNVFVCGHSHILRVMQDERFPLDNGTNMVVINPGAAGLQGFHLVRTAIRLKISDGALSDLEVLNVER